MDDKNELRLRRQALRLYAKGVKSQVILKRVHRSRAWLSKWQKRLGQSGTSGLHSQSRRPHHFPRAASPRIVHLVVQARRRLVKRKVGLIGPRAIRRELRPLRLGKHEPSLATIKRILHNQGLSTPPLALPPAYFPKPLVLLKGTLQAMDWTCRYLEAGTKVYAFHTLNLRTRACVQTVATDKSGPTVLAHCLTTWKTLGIPDFLQLDNDAAFCGGYKVPRVFGQLVRVSLALGIELVFLPIAEPECNGEVEELNGLWGRAFWERRRFRSFAHVRRASPAFLHWYLTQYGPPFLANQTPQQAQRTEPLHHLTAAQCARLQEPLPITAGRVHFIRRVRADGTITLLNETWRVSRRLAGKYVWATVITLCRRLEIWYRRSPHHDWRLLKSHAYDIPETVARLKPEFDGHKTG
jgi:putative transposase